MWVWAREELVVSYEKANSYVKAEVLLRESLAEAKDHLGRENPATTAVWARLVRSLLVQKKHTEAEAECREVLAIREKLEPDAWGTFNTQSLLGGILLGEKKYAQAEPLLLAGYEGMKKREKLIPPSAEGRLTEAVERLITLYKEQGKSDQAEMWTSKLAKGR
jgi:tetratricopeptide (TPR) repeat protein